MTFPSCKYYHITTATGGSIDRVSVDARDVDGKTEAEVRAAIGHAAWCHILNPYKGFEPKLRREHENCAKILKQVIGQIGVDVAKRKFTEAIKFEEQR